MDSKRRRSWLPRGKVLVAPSFDWQNRPCNHFPSEYVLSHDTFDFNHLAFLIMHRHNMANSGFSPKVHLNDVVCLTAHAQNQFRPDQSFYSSCPDTLGIYFNRNCLHLNGIKRGETVPLSKEESMSNWCRWYGRQVANRCVIQKKRDVVCGMYRRLSQAAEHSIRKQGVHNPDQVESQVPCDTGPNFHLIEFHLASLCEIKVLTIFKSMKLIFSWNLKYIHRRETCSKNGNFCNRGNCYTNLGDSLKVRHSRSSRGGGERTRETAPGMGFEGLQEAKMLRQKRCIRGVLQ